MDNIKNNVDYNTKVLEVKNLKKYFVHGSGKNKLIIPAVDGLTFDVYKREVFGLVGESGCGKTTTGRTLIKLYNPTEGVARLSGEIEELSGWQVLVGPRDSSGIPKFILEKWQKPV